MRQTIFILCLLMLELSSCNRIEKRVLNADINITIDHNDINKDVIEQSSRYVEEIQYIPLETNDENLIGEMTKVILSSKHIHVYDNQTNNLYQFDFEGKYIRKIGVEGNGPNEYIKISSFAVHPKTGNIAIYCEIKQSILEFTSEGLLIAKKKLGLVSSDLMYYKDNYLFYCGRFPNSSFFKDTYPEQPRLVTVKQDGTTEGYLPFEYNECLLRTAITSERNNLYTLNKRARLVERCTGIVYELSNQISPVYAIDFGKHTIQEDFYSNSSAIDEKRIQQIESSDYCSLSSLFETSNYIYIYYTVRHYNNLVCSCIYSKENGKVINIGPLWINDRDNISMPDIIATHGDRFVGYYNTYELNTMLITNEKPLSEAMKKMKGAIKDSDNPVVCIIKMKSE